MKGYKIYVIPLFCVNTANDDSYSIFALNTTKATKTWIYWMWIYGCDEIFRDLAARNILVFSKNKVKISDFGLSRALGQGKDYYQTNFNVNLKLPIAWCAPECITYLRFTSASDVWAFGVGTFHLYFSLFSVYYWHY